MKTYAETDTPSTVPAQLAAQAEEIRVQLADVRHIVAVMSGKGGVGKSTIAANLACALAGRGFAVGLVDGDVNGPSIGRIAGVAGYERAPLGSGIRPAIGYAGLKVMSMGFFLAGETAPVVWDAPTQKHGFAWRGLREAGALRSLIAQTEWGALDVMIVDLPPGPDRLVTLVDVLPRFSGALAVTIPSAVSAAAVGKSIRLARRHVDAPIFGLVENMGPHVCIECGHTEHLFPQGSTNRLIKELEISLLASVPFDPVLASASDTGECYIDKYPDRPAAKAIGELATNIDVFAADLSTIDRLTQP